MYPKRLKSFFTPEEWNILQDQSNRKRYHYLFQLAYVLSKTDYRDYWKQVKGYWIEARENDLIDEFGEVDVDAVIEYTEEGGYSFGTSIKPRQASPFEKILSLVVYGSTDYAEFFNIENSPKTA